MSDRRKNLRVPVEMDVVLNYRERVFVCTVRDLSLKGAFVHAAPDEMPYRNADIELGLSLTRNGECTHYRIPGNIKRITDDGVGISFSDLGIDVYSDLASVLYC